MKIRNSTLYPSWGDIKISRNKSFEYQFEKSNFLGSLPYEFELLWSRKIDHAGISFTFGIRGLFWMNLNIHDHRHWDYENNTWEKY
jgi:hypothetical protein